MERKRITGLLNGNKKSMIKVKFKKSNDNPKMVRELYTDITRLPFSVTIGPYTSLPTTIYARDISGANFIEFRFDKDFLNLYEISLLGVQNESIENREPYPMPVTEGEFYSCNIEEDDSVLDGVSPLKIIRGKNAVCIEWIKIDQPDITYFAVAKDCYIGVDDESFISSVLLTGLNEEEIVTILGF
jgi:hypothetical protein